MQHQRAAVILCKINGCGQTEAGQVESVFIKLKTAFLFFLILFSHAMCRPNLRWPCMERAGGSNFSSGRKSADELILMKELDVVGDALEGLLELGGRGGGIRVRGNRFKDEHPGSFYIS